MHSPFILVLGAIHNFHVVVRIPGTNVPASPRLVVAVAFHSLSACPFDGRHVSVRVTADPREEHTGKERHRVARVAPRVHGSVVAVAIVTAAECVHGRLELGLSADRVDADVMPCAVVRPAVVQPCAVGVVVAAPPPALVVPECDSLTRVVKVTDVVLGRVLCGEVASSPLHVPPVVKVFEVMDITEAVGGLDAGLVVGVDHPDISRSVRLVRLVRVLVVWDERVRVMWRAVHPSWLPAVVYIRCRLKWVRRAAASLPAAVMYGFTQVHVSALGRDRGKPGAGHNDDMVNVACRVPLCGRPPAGVHVRRSCGH
mmetsp:Transcript_7943/g.23495  ORF Transcript_7943/g.23495 Transcript_7943/m.23495 type:complete len:313 (+) Transcript_7943:149-1087(+)